MYAKCSVCRLPEKCPILEFTAVAGPTHERHPPFQWSKTNLGDVPNFRTIDKFDFEPVRTTWIVFGKRCVIMKTDNEMQIRARILRKAPWHYYICK